ncbi:MAG: hypothetical protein B7Y39_05505 [Bdellovibrio sp. 28-41-41]|nr:MAG: hypothetical protein B7Y39_05505 [Bdellovibrio sp. 28-41-41]
MLRYFFILLLALSPASFAEYRVFELEITSYADNGNGTDTASVTGATAVTSPAPEETGKKTLLSTLDPEQYRGYHTIQPNEKVRYISTWRCKGRTTGKDYCPNPKAKTEGEVAAAPSENK